MTERTDPRITRTVHALEQAIVELAAQQPVSRISVAALADRAGVTRATFYNRYDSPLDLLIQVLYADLDRGHRREQDLRAEGTHSAAEMLRLTTAEVAEHVERFRTVYRQALQDPADRGVYEALVRHFADYAMAFMARSDDPGVPRANQEVVAAFMAHGFAGAIAAWLGDDTVTKADLVDAAVACAPYWWT
ncbi:AcrR family transcriptional regulator [Catenulispora sp. GAS73]|uniref:TetR/AcrR family transcriptional regulator n=1 Tax=Catenulispora sp. GAS73 TaxID=3156269 RepID=UPI00351481AE